MGHLDTDTDTDKEVRMNSNTVIVLSTPQYNQLPATARHSDRGHYFAKVNGEFIRVRFSHTLPKVRPIALKLSVEVSA